MAARPLGPWRRASARGDRVDIRAGTPLYGTVYAEFSGLYFQLRRAGISPTVADRCKLWELAAALGSDEPNDEQSAVSEAELGTEMQRRRILAAEQGKRPPTWRELEDELTGGRGDPAARRRREQLLSAGWVGPADLPAT